MHLRDFGNFWTQISRAKKSVNSCKSEEHLTGYPLYLTFKFRAADITTAQSFLPQPWLELWVEMGLQYFGSLWSFDCRSIASASPVAVQPLVVVGSSVWWPPVAPPVALRLRPYFSASAFLQNRSNRCLAERLGGTQDRGSARMTVHPRANVVWYDRCTVLLIFDMVS